MGLMCRQLGFIFSLSAVLSSVIGVAENLEQYQRNETLYSKLTKRSSKVDSKNPLFTGGPRSTCGGYHRGVETVNITLPNIPISSNSSYTECEWIVVGDSARRIWIKFLKFDLPEQSPGGFCDAAYVTFGGYSDNLEKIAHVRLCGRTVPVAYRTPSSSAWVSLVWTGRSATTQERPVTVKVQFSLEENGPYFRQVVAGIVCFTSLTIVLLVPSIFYCKTSRQTSEFGLWSASLDADKREWHQNFRTMLEEMEYVSVPKVKQNSAERRNVLRRSIRNLISGCSKRLRKPCHRFKRDATIHQNSLISKRLTLWAELKNSGHIPESPVVVLHPPKSTCLDESIQHRQQNATLLQSILRTFPVSHSEAISEGPTVFARSLPLHDVAASLTEKNAMPYNSVHSTSLPPVHIMHGNITQRSLATICSEESFRAVANSNDRCSTPCLNIELTPNSSGNNHGVNRLESCYDSFFLDREQCVSDRETVREDVFLNQTCASGLSGITNLASSKDEDEYYFGRNSGKIGETMDTQKMLVASNEQKVDDHSENHLQLSTNNESSKTSIGFRCNLMQLFPNNKRAEENQVALSPDSDFTFVSNLTKSSDFEPGENVNIDSALNYLRQHGLITDSPSQNNKTKKFSCWDSILEPERRLLGTSVKNDQEPVIVIDLQPTTNLGSSSATYSSCQKNSIQFVKNRMVFHPGQMDVVTYKTRHAGSSTKTGSIECCSKELSIPGTHSDECQNASWFDPNDLCQLDNGDNGKLSRKNLGHHNQQFCMICPNEFRRPGDVLEDTATGQSVITDHSTSDTRHADQMQNICRETVL